MLEAIALIFHQENKANKNQDTTDASPQKLRFDTSVHIFMIFQVARRNKKQKQNVRAAENHNLVVVLKDLLLWKY